MHAEVRRPGHRCDVVVLDDEDLGMLREYFPQVALSLGVQSRARRVLAARCSDDCLGSPLERDLERVGVEAALVDRRRLGLEPERPDQVRDPRPAGVLDDNSIAGPKLRLQNSLDRVERAADDCDVAVDAVGGEVGLRQLDELREPDRTAVELVLGIDAGERRAERWQQRRVGVAAGEVARAGRKRRSADHPQRRLDRDDGPAAAIGADEAAVLERPVGGGDRRRAHLELGRQVANRRQTVGRRESVPRDRRLDARGDRRGPGTALDLLC